MKGLLRSTVWQALQPNRYFNSTITCWGVDKSLLSKLRKQTGIPFINCKKALEKHDNNFDEAKAWLVEEAQKAGWARATKLQSRPMSQGLVAIVGDSRQVTMLEVNCETDFVAKNEKFLAMVEQLAKDCSIHFEKQEQKMIFAGKEDLDLVKSQSHGTLADIIAVNVGNLGENMALRRGSFLRADDNSELSCYVHPSAPGQIAKRLQFGKYGAVVETIRQEEVDKPVMDMNELGNHLCQHIVGMNPKTVGKFSDLKEKDIAITNEEVIENTDKVDEVDEDSLLNQEFLLDSSMKVGEFLSLNCVEVKNFARFACGEELDNEK